MARNFVRTSGNYIGRGGRITSDTDNITFGGWIKRATTGQSHTIFGNGVTGGFGQGYGLLVHGSADKARIDVSFVTDITGTTTIDADTWYHILGRRVSGTWHIHVNGVSENTKTNNPYGLGDDSDTVIGAYKHSIWGHEDHHNGDLAEIAFWNRALSQAEVTALAKGFSPEFFPKNLLTYKPLVDPATLDYKDSASWTISGTTKSGHPRIIRPTPQQIMTLQAGAVAPSTAVKDLIMGGIIPFAR